MANNLEFVESLKCNSHYKDWRYFIDRTFKYGYDWHLFLSLLLLEIDLFPVQVDALSIPYTVEK